MPVTLIPIAYRDNNHFRTWGQLVAPGELTDRLRARLLATLSPWRRFIPEQLGHRHLGWTVPTFTTFPNRVDDHAWHELMLGSAFAVDDTNPLSGDGMRFDSVEAMVEAFEAAHATGWSSHAFDPCREVTPQRRRRMRNLRLNEPIRQPALPL